MRFSRALLPRLPGISLTLAAATLTSVALAEDNVSFEEAPCTNYIGGLDRPVADNAPSRTPTKECLKKGTSNSAWSEPEHWAWTQICQRRQINFDRRYCPPNSYFDIASDGQDAKRHLSGNFIRQIFEDHTYASELRAASVYIEGATIDSIDIKDVEIGSLQLYVTKVEGDISFTNLTIGRVLTLLASKVAGRLELKNVKGGNIAIGNTTLKSVVADQLDMNRLRLHSSDVQFLNVDNSTFNEELEVSYGSFLNIRFLDNKSNGLIVRANSLSTFRVLDYLDQGSFTLEVEKWSGESALFLRGVSTGTFRNLSKGEPPKKSTFIDFSFSGADLGDNPTPYLAALLNSSQEYNPGIYTVVAKSYAAAGRGDLAQEILIAQSDAELRSSSTPWFRKLYLSITRYVVGYGYRPEIGLAWIFGFVVVSTLVFRSAAEIASGEPPRSWFVFSLDAVIPGISLDKDHDKIAFRGWRQWFLYFLRFLGAVVVVLIIGIIRNSVVGASG
jgi:hypothetical protein